MKLPTLLLLLVLTVVVVFAIVNWSVITAPATVSLLVTDVQAPLGLIMLGLAVLITVLFLIYLAYLQTSVLLEARRHSRELQAQRELADQAEASRFTDLRGFLDTELRKLAGQFAESRAVVSGRVDQSERDLRTTIEETGNSLAAQIGELEDRLERPLLRGPLRSGEREL
ncbi:MAG: LapA family protein [Prolixibacteraceae bacterium]|nr:LapA family protein [Burkholderiales bacterium]